jgi:hypothetical protein
MVHHQLALAPVFHRLRLEYHWAVCRETSQLLLITKAFPAAIERLTIDVIHRYIPHRTEVFRVVCELERTKDAWSQNAEF